MRRLSNTRVHLPAFLRALEGRVLVAVMMLAAGGWAFAELADAVVENKTQALDEQILLALREPGDRSDPIGPRWVEEIGRDLTALGGMTVVGLVTATVVFYLWSREKRRTAVLVLASIVGAVVVSTLFKFGFARPRPDLVPHGSIVATSSFPSGHSTLAAAAYLTLAGLMVRTHAARRLKIFFLVSALGITFLVGVSRVFLGVHWPSDVLGGWALGAMWAALCWTVAFWLQRRGKIESTPADAPTSEDPSAPR